MGHDQPINGHCEGCGEDRLDVKHYDWLYENPLGERAWLEASWCNDCATLAKANWNGHTLSVRPHKSGVT